MKGNEIVVMVGVCCFLHCKWWYVSREWGSSWWKVEEQTLMNGGMKVYDDDSRFHSTALLFFLVHYPSIYIIDLRLWVWKKKCKFVRILDP